MEKKSEKRETVKIELEIFLNEWIEANECYRKIVDLLKENKKIPAKLLKKFISFYKSTPHLNQIEIDKQVKILTDETLDYFKNTKFNFVFDKKIRQEVIHKSARAG